MNRNGLDIYDERPEEMTAYLRHWGLHFSKRAYEFAVKMMRRRKDDGGKTERIEPMSKEQVDDFLRKYGINLENDVAYDSAYVLMMGKADHYKSAIVDEPHLAAYVRDVVDDVDGSDGDIFNCWYAKMVRAGVPVPWEDIL